MGKVLLSKIPFVVGGDDAYSVLNIIIDCKWKIIDLKRFFIHVLAEIAGIDKNVLLTGNVKNVSVAAKMS